MAFEKRWFSIFAELADGSETCCFDGESTYGEVVDACQKYLRESGRHARACIGKECGRVIFNTKDWVV